MSTTSPVTRKWLERIPANAKPFGHVCIRGEAPLPHGYIDCECELGLKAPLPHSTHFEVLETVLKIDAFQIERREQTYSLLIQSADEGETDGTVLGINNSYRNGGTIGLRSDLTLISAGGTEKIDAGVNIIPFIHAFVYYFIVKSGPPADEKGRRMDPWLFGITRLEKEMLERASGVTIMDIALDLKLFFGARARPA